MLLYLEFIKLPTLLFVCTNGGFPADYLVSPNWSCATSADWNYELCYRLGLLLKHVRPSVIVFDGTWPYQWVMGACRAYGKAVVD